MQNTRNFSIGQGIGSALGGIAGLFGIGTPNTGKANNYLAQMQPSIDRYLQPYIGAGHNAMGTVQGQYGDLLNNPGDMLSKMGAGYQQSPGYQYNVDQMTKAANNAAAAGGYIGSPQQQEYMAKQIGGLANQDYNQYLNNVMGLYGQGLQGMGNINQMGFQASGMANQTLSDMLKAQAQLAYADAMNKANSQSSGFGGLLGGVGKVIGGLLF
jgi:gas vesicle protein